MPTSPIKPIYYIPFKKIFKEDIKEIDIDELKYNDYKENEKFIIPAKQIRGRTESNGRWHGHRRNTRERPAPS
jgi:hypothetical protein